MNGIADMAEDLNTKNGKPAFVTFSTVAKHLKAESDKAGRYVAEDVDMVTVRQLGATDSVMFKVESWLKQNELDVQGGRLDAGHAKLYAESYKRWKQGQEMPVTGTPIKSWPVISPAQVEVLLKVGIRTVEDLAGINDEGLHKIGMGAVDLKNKAKSWMAVSQDKGQVTQQMAGLVKVNEQLSATVEKLTEKLEMLQAEIKAAKKPKSRKKVEDDEEAELLGE